MLTKGTALCIYVHMERDSKKIVKRLIAEGFELVSTKGSHHKFRKDSRTVIIPHPKKDLPLGTPAVSRKWQAGSDPGQGR
jgi:predicted RNA binding protein YcfA (HicA-like mRNA interferase family)